MATARPRTRPLSPHLQIWRWGPHMLVSILHRATGIALGTAGLALATWWLAAAAGGEAHYARFLGWFTGPFAILGYLFGIGLTLALFQHMGTGIRHFVLDTGAGYELRRNKRGAIATMVFSVLATALLWAWLIVGKA